MAVTPVIVTRREWCSSVWANCRFCPHRKKLKATGLTQADYPFGARRGSLLRCAASGGAASANVWADDELSYR
jgi:hypothetical protein